MTTDPQTSNSKDENKVKGSFGTKLLSHGARNEGHSSLLGIPGQGCQGPTSGGEDTHWVLLNDRVSDNGLIKGKAAYSSTRLSASTWDKRGGVNVTPDGPEVCPDLSRTCWQSHREAA